MVAAVAVMVVGRIADVIVAVVCSTDAGDDSTSGRGGYSSSSD